MNPRSLILACLSLMTGALPSPLVAATVEYDLEIAEQVLSPAGKPVKALTINGTMPGPTLRFRVGDTAVIRVHNRLKHEETSTHWHGLLLPNEQDGVPYVTTPPIKAGQTHTFTFPLRHAGTYWFHSHTGLQEQRGVLGSIVVLPHGGEAEHADVDQVMVLSDWTNENPHEVLRSLKRGTNWYPVKKGTAQSIVGAMQKGMLKDYLARERSRMPPMDISDVAYDAFLINGLRQFDVPAKAGQTVRLRFINAGAATYFYLESATGPLTIVAADGTPVQPVKVQRLLMGIAETYDVLLTVPANGRWELRATAQDGSGRSSAFFGSGTEHPAPDVPKPNLYSMDDMLMAALNDMDADSTEPAPARPMAPYRKLRSVKPTTLPAGLPVREMKLRLTGDMQRYIWSFNDKTIDEDGVIPVKRGEILRMELVNDTMMHHPIHLHGHFFRLLNGQGAWSPLKHTVDVPPMGRRTIEFEANEQGDWMFHCHILYHMMEGMARIVSYQKALPMGGASPHLMSHMPAMGEHAMPMLYPFADFNVLSQLSDGTATLMSGRNALRVPWEIGWQQTNGKTEYEIDLLYERYFNPNFGAFTGARLTNISGAENRAIAGFWYRLPYLVVFTANVGSTGDFRFNIGKTFQITPRFSVNARAQYDTQQIWELAFGAEYMLTKRLSLSTAYHTDYGFGAGLGFRF
ncbi:multicopper oxidase domain-containing protein [Prosthecobacter sp.]|uniref:multicopper oxidase domain-containing protein n=1 Tax=Prosthecobacter sp. TaxID=1965333 RepID=UPI002489C21C|nr:multicopper oxidase domain-containing protein [Prosthecobacter sp.]MDI1311904.1 multicopper oxidase domain-containing protein [Prosthecobacter sp.]